MFLSLDIQLCKIYTKFHIYVILYKSCSIKQIIFNKYSTNLEMTISHRIEFFNLYFAFLILNIIDNIITYSPYSPYYVTIT